jgi:peptidyl-prolyl cis-trans isomerase C
MHCKPMGRLTLLVVLLLATACAPIATLPPPTAAESDASTPLPPTAEGSTAVPETVSSPVPTSEPLAALVNNQPLALADYERALLQYQADLQASGTDPNSAEGQEQIGQAREWILNVLIEQLLTEQAAAAAGVVVSDAEVDAYMQMLVEENGGQEAFVAKLAERGETYESAWHEVRAGLIGMLMTDQIIAGVPQTTEHVHARHILVDTPEEAQSILAQLQSGADFAAQAQQYSQDASTKDAGGDLGFFPRGILMAPEVEEAAFALQPGQFSDVVATSLGYHIVQVIERDPARQVSPENLRLLQDRALQEWVEGLWAGASVERYIEATP